MRIFKGMSSISFQTKSVRQAVFKTDTAYTNTKNTNKQNKN